MEVAEEAVVVEDVVKITKDFVEIEDEVGRVDEDVVIDEKGAVGVEDEVVEV